MTQPTKTIRDNSASRNCNILHEDINQMEGF